MRQSSSPLALTKARYERVPPHEPGQGSSSQAPPPFDHAAAALATEDDDGEEVHITVEEDAGPVAPRNVSIPPTYRNDWSQ